MDTLKIILDRSARSEDNQTLLYVAGHASAVLDRELDIKSATLSLGLLTTAFIRSTLGGDIEKGHELISAVADDAMLHKDGEPDPTALANSTARITAAWNEWVIVTQAKEAEINAALPQDLRAMLEALGLEGR